MSEATRRQIDADQDREEAEETGRQALLEQAAGAGPTRAAWNRLRQDNRTAIARPTEDEEDWT